MFKTFDYTKMKTHRIYTHLAKITDYMTSIHIGQRHNVEKEGLHIVIKGFVIQEELCQQTQMLAILLVTLPVHLPHLQFSLAVYLIARRMPPDAFLGVPLYASL